MLTTFPIFYNKKVVLDKMIQITREEAMQIRERNENITICNRQGHSKKKTWYVPESYAVVRLLKEIESKKKIEHFE